MILYVTFTYKLILLKSVIQQLPPATPMSKTNRGLYIPACRQAGIGGLPAPPNAVGPPHAGGFFLPVPFTPQHCGGRRAWGQPVPIFREQKSDRKEFIQDSVGDTSHRTSGASNLDASFLPRSLGDRARLCPVRKLINKEGAVIQSAGFHISGLLYLTLPGTLRFNVAYTKLPVLSSIVFAGLFLCKATKINSGQRRC